MTRWLEKLHRDRCARKAAYTVSVAEKLAEKASLRTGDLILTYRCFDCGMWHIGHADAVQIAAHAPSPNCVNCRKRIPAARLEKAERLGITITTCSKKCAQAAERREQRRSQGGSKGVAKAPS